MVTKKKRILFLVVAMELLSLIWTNKILADYPFCDGSTDKIETALGCFPMTVNGFVGWILPLIFGIAGGIAFILMVFGFIMVATSGGDEKKLQGAKETITSAITGLLVSIFALFILRLVAVNILHIPGLG